MTKYMLQLWFLFVHDMIVYANRSSIFRHAIHRCWYRYTVLYCIATVLSLYFVVTVIDHRHKVSSVGMDQMILPPDC